MTDVADLFVILHRLNEDLTFDVSIVLVGNPDKCMYMGNLKRTKGTHVQVNKITSFLRVPGLYELLSSLRWWSKKKIIHKLVYPTVSQIRFQDSPGTTKWLINQLLAHSSCPHWLSANAYDFNLDC